MFIFTPHTALKANVFIGHRIQNVGGGRGARRNKEKILQIKEEWLVVTETYCMKNRSLSRLQNKKKIHSVCTCSELWALVSVCTCFKLWALTSACTCSELWALVACAFVQNCGPWSLCALVQSCGLWWNDLCLF